MLGLAITDVRAEPSAASTAFRIALPAAAATAACAGIVIFANGVETSTGHDSGAGDSISYEGWVACLSTVVEGDVVAVRQDTPEDRRVLVTVDVDDWIKPARGPARVDLTLHEHRPAYESIEPGDHVLFQVPIPRLNNERWGWGYADGGDRIPEERAEIERALPESQSLECSF